MSQNSFRVTRPPPHVSVDRGTPQASTRVDESCVLLKKGGDGMTLKRVHDELAIMKKMRAASLRQPNMSVVVKGGPGAARKHSGFTSAWRPKQRKTLPLPPSTPATIPKVSGLHPA